jgi:hypothetical protein
MQKCLRERLFVYAIFGVKRAALLIAGCFQLASSRELPTMRGEPASHPDVLHDSISALRHPRVEGRKKVLKCLCNAYVISLLANGKRFSSQLLRVDKQVQQAMMRKYLSKTLRGFSSSARRFNQRKRVRRRRKPENYCTPR